MSARVYASVSDITARGYSLTSQQTEAAEYLLSDASARLRVTAQNHGKDIDATLDSSDKGEDYAALVKSIVIQAVMRALNSITDSSSAAVSQISQGGLGYTASMTYLNAGQSLYFLRSELKELGILRQTYGALEVYHATADTGNIY